MHARKILALALSAGLVASSVVPVVAPTPAYAFLDGMPPIWISGGSDVTTDHDVCEVKVNVGGYVYHNGEAAPFILGSDDEVSVTLRLGRDYLAESYDLCMRNTNGSVEVLATQPVTWGKNTLGDIWPVAQEFTIKVPGTKIISKGSVFARVPSTNNPPQTEIAVPLNIMELEKGGDYSIPSNLNLGLESAGFTLPGGIDLIGGSTITFGRGSIPFKTKVDKDGTRTNTINVDPMTFNTWGGTDELEALSKAQQSYDKLVLGGSGGIGFKSFTPTWKLAAVYRWNNQIPRKNAAMLAFSYGLMGGITGQYLIFTADLDITGMLGFKGSYGIDYDGNSTLAVGPTGSLSARLGVGLGQSFVGRVGAYGSLTLDAWYLLLPKEDSGWESATLTGKLGAEAVLLGKRVYDWPIATGGPWYLVKPSHPYLVTASAHELLDDGLHEAFAAADAEALDEDLSRAYLDHTGAWLGGEDVRAESARALVTASDGERVEAAAASVEPRVLQEGGYPDAQVSIAETPAGTVMVWLRDDPTRGDANRSQLMWSRHDEATDSWTQPKPVAPDATADFDPTLFVDEAGTAHVAWLDAAEPLADGLSLEQTAERVGVSYARLDNGAASFARTEQVAAPEVGEAKAAPELAASDGGVAVGWATYETSHLLDAGGTHDVVLASRADGSWTASTVVDSTESAISSLGVGVLDGKLNLAWTEDADGDLLNRDDTRLLSVSAGASRPAVLATGGVSNVQFASDAGIGALTWKGKATGQAGVLRTAAAGEGEPEGEDALWSVTAPGGEPTVLANGVSLPSSYQLDGDLTHGATLSYAALVDGGAQVYARSLSASDGLGAEGLLLTHDDNITSWDVVNQGKGVSAVFAAERGVGSGQNEADLCVVEDENPRFMQLDNVLVEGDQVPGGTVEISGEVTNVGARTLDGVTMRLVNEGDIMLTQSFEGDIKPGETREVRLAYTLPNDFSYDPDRTLRLHACFHGTAGIANSASAGVALTGSARLEVEAHDVPYGEKEKVYVGLTNHGAQPASGTVHFFTTGEDGEEADLESAEFGPIGAGETAYLGVSPDDVPSFGKMGIDYLGARVSLAQDAEELYAGTYTWASELLDEAEKPVGAESETGWEYEDGTWYVGVTADGLGSRHKTGWHWDDGWYYLDPQADGALASGWLEEGGRRYWLNTRHDGRFGRMATGWIFLEGEWYLAAPSGALQTGWAWDGATKAWYCLREGDGRMLRDATAPDGLRVDATGRWIA